MPPSSQPPKDVPSIAPQTTVSEHCKYSRSNTSTCPIDSASSAVHAADADVVFRSSDNVAFYIHRKNLEIHAAGFPPDSFSTRGEIVPLTEDAETLEVLFHYVYPQRLDDIDLLEFGVLYKLAEAAEKYQVFSVIQLCKMRIKWVDRSISWVIEKHPAQILIYAEKHGYSDILEMAVSHVLDLPLQEVMRILPPRLAIPWFFKVLDCHLLSDLISASMSSSSETTESIEEDEPRVSELFQAADADVVFISSDGVLFHIHRKHLESHSGGFPSAKFSTNGEIVPLTEDASTLETLFQYVYPQRYPDVDSLPFEKLYKLAEAAEKYEVFGVMQLCKMQLKRVDFFMAGRWADCDFMYILQVRK
ncbi:hypothetical protein H0H87_006783 [Tephrocybe sp. NHM501043]|nr:hypothetical protein H0H87_006783 [Tephrocybe sp. NHM501043]